MGTYYRCKKRPEKGSWDVGRNYLVHDWGVSVP